MFEYCTVSHLDDVAYIIRNFFFFLSISKIISTTMLLKLPCNKTYIIIVQTLACSNVIEKYWIIIGTTYNDIVTAKMVNSAILKCVTKLLTFQTIILCRILKEEKNESVSLNEGKRNMFVRVRMVNFTQ